MLRLFVRSLECSLSYSSDESTDEIESRRRFLSESVRRLWGGSVMLGDRPRGSGERPLDAFLRAVGFLAARWGDGDRDTPVDILETDAEDTDVDLILFDVPETSASSRSRFRPLSWSAFARSSSAMPFLKRKVSIEFGSMPNAHGQTSRKRDWWNYTLSQKILRGITCQLWL